MRVLLECPLVHRVERVEQVHLQRAGSCRARGSELAGDIRANSAPTCVRYAVAPTPTGSSTHGIARARARNAARRMASTHLGDSVPMLITSAREIETKSSTSSTACTMAGDAPTASSALAVVFFTT